MARTEEYPIKKLVGFDNAMIERLDAYRRVQTPIPNVSEAIRALLDEALAAHGIA